MQNRGASQRPSYDELVEIVRRQQQQIERLEAQLAQALAQNERLAAENARLRAENEDLRRRQRRSAAPFSRDTPTPNPKRPGRKPGEGRFTHASPPPSDAVDTEHVPVSAPPSACPHCGGELAADGEEEATILELPEQMRLKLRRFRVPLCRCRRCGKRVRGRHPDLARDQFGATSHRIGPRLRALCHLLHFGLGLTQRKLPRLLFELFGVTLTQSAICQDALLQSRRQVGAVYQHLREQVGQSEVSFNDDTGWRIGGQPAWLMACDTSAACVYQVRSRHRNEEVRELIPSEYQGVLTSDRARSYDAKELSRVKKQKCLSHLIRSCSLVQQSKQRKSRWFSGRLKSLLKEAVALWHGRAELAAGDYLLKRDALLQQLTSHLRDRPLRDADNQRLLNEIGSQHDQGHLLRFLLEPERLEPTNNRAERALRPAVIARKVSHCSKTQEGADAFCAFTSVIQTLTKQGQASHLEPLAALLAAPVPATPPNR